jgi:hypothetical protein
MVKLIICAARPASPTGVQRLLAREAGPLVKSVTEFAARAEVHLMPPEGHVGAVQIAAPTTA